MEAFGLVIVGSGPAGPSAASHAQANGMRFVLLERTDHLSDTIDAYQARKCVMAQPMMIPARGAVPFKAGSRESMLEAWRGPVEERQLNRRLQAEIKSVKHERNTFRV